jgi:two-component system, cell cycle response regulator
LEEDIITDLTVLQDRLDKMINRVELRDSTLQHYRQFQETLFTLNSLPEMIDSVLAQAKLFFKLDAVNLMLLNEEAKITGYLGETGYNYQQNQNLLLLDHKTRVNHELTGSTFIGGYDHAKHSVFFPSTKQKPHDVIIIPLIRHGEYLGSLNLANYKSGTLPHKIRLEFVAQIGFSISICLENHLNFAIAQQAYRNEALANANNRRFLEQRLVEALERGQRSTHSLSCVMLDVDFPALPDHQTAAQLKIQVLQTVAETVKRQLRVGDVFSYYDGKKFAAFLVDVPENVVISITERLKTAIAEQVINFANQIIPLSIALGFASYPLDKPPVEAKTNQQIALELIAAADANLYDTKHKHSVQQKKSLPLKIVS